MKFTYEAYRNWVNELSINGYSFADYNNYADFDKCVIMRHDVDQNLSKAVTLAEVEHDLGIRSTFFILLTSDFYNVASKSNIERIEKIKNLGHSIGLHFDELAYRNIDDIVCLIKKEAKILSDIIDCPIETVSMHRPSAQTLEADYVIPGMVNSYGKTFFHEFKYLSDSRRHWREPVDDIVKSGAYNKLHILTHPFWYSESDTDMQDTIRDFVNYACHERYTQMKDNISDLESILSEEDL